MKISKKEFNKLSIIGKIVYYLGCLKYKEKYIRDSTLDPKKEEIAVSFIIRWWNPFSIIFILLSGFVNYSDGIALSYNILREKKGTQS